MFFKFSFFPGEELNFVLYYCFFLLFLWSWSCCLFLVVKNSVNKRLFEIYCIDFSPYSSELEGSAVQMVEMYCKNLPLSKDLDSQESMHGEELLSLACNAFIQVCESSLFCFI